MNSTGRGDPPPWLPHDEGYKSSRGTKTVPTDSSLGAEECVFVPIEGPVKKQYQVAVGVAGKAEYRPGYRKENIMSKIYNSRFWVTLVALTIPLVNHLFGLALDAEEFAYIAGIAAAFVLGESYRKARVG